jgi:hypothetical protein
MWVAANMMGEGPYERNVCIASGIVRAFRRMFRPGSYSSYRAEHRATLCWALENLMWHQPRPHLDSAENKEFIGDVLSALETEDDHKGRAHLAAAVVHMKVSDVRVVPRKGLMLRLVHLITTAAPATVNSALAICCDITGEDDNAGSQALLKADLLPALVHLLDSASDGNDGGGGVRPDLIWMCLGNVAGGTAAQNGAVIKSGMMSRALNLLRDEKVDIREAERLAWVIGNMACHPKGSAIAVREGAIALFGALLKRVGEDDAKVVVTCLSALKYVMENCDGGGYDTPATLECEQSGVLKQITAYRNSASKAVRESADDIIGTFWDVVVIDNPQ